MSVSISTILVCNRQGQFSLRPDRQSRINDGMNEPLISELQQEARTTRTLLERVPGDKLAWKPHEKSMSLGELAIHIARLPGGMAKVAQLPELDISKRNPPPAPAASTGEILATFDESIAAATAYIQALTPEDAGAPWTLRFKEKTLFTGPRTAMLRTMLFNHLYHHRGQLSVYLRLLDVPVPVIYGRSADEGPGE